MGTRGAIKSHVMYVYACTGNYTFTSFYIRATCARAIGYTIAHTPVCSCWCAATVAASKLRKTTQSHNHAMSKTKHAENTMLELQLRSKGRLRRDVAKRGHMQSGSIVPGNGTASRAPPSIGGQSTGLQSGFSSPQLLLLSGSGGRGAKITTNKKSQHSTTYLWHTN